MSQDQYIGYRHSSVQIRSTSRILDYIYYWCFLCNSIFYFFILYLKKLRSLEMVWSIYLNISLCLFEKVEVIRDYLFNPSQSTTNRSNSLYINTLIIPYKVVSSSPQTFQHECTRSSVFLTDVKRYSIKMNEPNHLSSWSHSGVYWSLFLLNILPYSS